MARSEAARKGWEGEPKGSMHCAFGQSRLPRPRGGAPLSGAGRQLVVVTELGGDDHPPELSVLAVYGPDEVQHGYRPPTVRSEVGRRKGTAADVAARQPEGPGAEAEGEIRGGRQSGRQAAV